MPCLHHRADNQLDVLLRPAEKTLPFLQAIRDAGRGDGFKHSRHWNLVLLRPAAVGRLPREGVLQFGVQHEAMRVQVAPKDFAWLQSSFADNLLWLQVKHACFGRENEQAVLRQ